MRPWILILVAIFSGVAMGLGATFIEFGPSPTGNVEAAFQLGINGGDGPRVVVDEEEFNFGNMELDARDSHEFSIRNEGKSPLQLRDGGVSCGLCTEQSITKNVLAPGERTTVQVRWHANKEGPFHQSAFVNTNDPARPRLSFNLAGKVMNSHRVDPTELVFSSLSSKEKQTADVLIYSYRDGQLAVLSTKVADAETADKFEISSEPMPKEKLEQDKDAKSGVVVHVTVKPGLPLGTLRQKIEIKLNLEGEPTVELPISGNTVSDVVLVGRNWDSERGLLRFDTVSASEGAKAELFLQVHGAQNQSLHPKVNDITPKGDLQVTIGDPVSIAGGKLVKVPITVEIPRGSRPVSHLGGDEGKLGEIMIDTGDADGEKLRVRVRYAIVD